MNLRKVYIRHSSCEGYHARIQRLSAAAYPAKATTPSHRTFPNPSDMLQQFLIIDLMIGKVDFVRKQELIKLVFNLELIGKRE